MGYESFAVTMTSAPESWMAVESDERFPNIMAIALDRQVGYREGVIRCICSRKGDIAKDGIVDHSALHRVRMGVSGRFSIGERLAIGNADEVIRYLGGGLDFLGMEDPDLWIDDAGRIHLYCTLPFCDPSRNRTLIYLGHAEGNDLSSLTMTLPVLSPNADGSSAKELSIAPVNRQGSRYNLVESSAPGDRYAYSTVRVAIARDMGKPWAFGKTVFHPAEHRIPWAGGHASPGPLFPDTFINVGRGKRLGLLNGREANRCDGAAVCYGMFSVGFFLYNYEEGEIEWVSPEPLLRAPDAHKVLFASQFVETEQGQGVVYAHVDDSTVHAYPLSADMVKKKLP